MLKDACPFKLEKGQLFELRKFDNMTHSNALIKFGLSRNRHIHITSCTCTSVRYRDCVDRHHEFCMFVVGWRAFVHHSTSRDYYSYVI